MIRWHLPRACFLLKRLQAGWTSEDEKPGLLRPRGAHTRKYRWPDYKPDDEDKNEKELEKEEDESEADEPGKYEPLSITDKKLRPKVEERTKNKSMR